MLLLLVVEWKYRIKSLGHYDRDQFFQLIVVIPKFQDGGYLPE